MTEADREVEMILETDTEEETVVKTSVQPQLKELAEAFATELSTPFLEENKVYDDFVKKRDASLTTVIIFGRRMNNLQIPNEVNSLIAFIDVAVRQAQQQAGLVLFRFRDASCESEMVNKLEALAKRVDSKWLHRHTIMRIGECIDAVQACLATSMACIAKFMPMRKDTPENDLEGAKEQHGVLMREANSNIEEAMSICEDLGANISKLGDGLREIRDTILKSESLDTNVSANVDADADSETKVMTRAKAKEESVTLEVSELVTKKAGRRTKAKVDAITYVLAELPVLSTLDKAFGKGEDINLYPVSEYFDSLKSALTKAKILNSEVADQVSRLGDVINDIRLAFGHKFADVRYIERKVALLESELAERGCVAGDVVSRTWIGYPYKMSAEVHTSAIAKIMSSQAEASAIAKNAVSTDNPEEALQALALSTIHCKLVRKAEEISNSISELCSEDLRSFDSVKDTLSKVSKRLRKFADASVSTNSHTRAEVEATNLMLTEACKVIDAVSGVTLGEGCSRG